MNCKYKYIGNKPIKNNQLLNNIDNPMDDIKTNPK